MSIVNRETSIWLAICDSAFTIDVSRLTIDITHHSSLILSGRIYSPPNMFFRGVRVCCPTLPQARAQVAFTHLQICFSGVFVNAPLRFLRPALRSHLREE